MHNEHQDPVEPGPRTALRHRGFTLIELIALIATMAVLALLLVPALARSSDQGARTVCANNLRQLGRASLMYANDNLDYMAYPNWGNVTAWPGWLYMATNGSLPDPGPGGTYATNPIIAYSTGLWFQYIREPKTYLCPVDIESSSYAGRPDGGSTTRLQRLSSYVMNGAACGYTTIARSARISDVWNPACYLLWGPDENYAGPGIPGAFDFNDGANFPDRNEGVERLHTLNGGLVATVGGNVQFVSRTTFAAQTTAPGRGLAWWSPFSGTGH